MFTAIQLHAAKHAMTYLVAMLLGLAASMTAIYDNFWIITPEQAGTFRWFHWMALWAKCLAPFATTVTAYLIKSPLSDKEAEGRSGGGEAQGTQPGLPTK
jgi:hypothetical protein